MERPDARKLTDAGVDVCWTLLDKQRSEMPLHLIRKMEDGCRNAANLASGKRRGSQQGSGNRQRHDLPMMELYFLTLMEYILSLREVNFNTVRLYTYYATISELGRMPRFSLMSVGMLLFNLERKTIRKIFGGRFFAGDDSYTDEYEKMIIKCSQRFVGSAHIPLIPNPAEQNARSKAEMPTMLLRPATPRESKDMNETINKITEYIIFPCENLEILKCGHLDKTKISETEENLSNLYVNIINSNFLNHQEKKKGEEIIHRAPSSIEAIAEHMIICLKCAGIPKLLELCENFLGDAEKSLLQTLQLHVPECFQAPSRDGEQI